MYDARRPAPHRRLGVLTAVAVVLAPAQPGCRDATAPLSAADVVGTYALQTVDGQALPEVLRQSDPPVLLYAEQYTLAADGTYTGLDVFGHPGSAVRDTTVTPNRWRFAHGSGGQDSVYVTFGSTEQSRFEFGYAVRDGGRTLVADKTVLGTPYPVHVYARR